MKIEIIHTSKKDPLSAHCLYIYEIEDGCDRVLMDVRDNDFRPKVWGFKKSNDPNNPIQVEGKIISKTDPSYMMA